MGGTVELQVMLQSLAEGFAIVGVMGVFGAFNSVVSHSELVESTPRAFFELGLVIVVGLAFVPSTLAAIHDVREADRARTGGRVVRRGRLLRQVVPVLELGLERAVTLAESMDSRGFARAGASPRDRAAGWWGLASLLLARRLVRRADRRSRHDGRGARTRGRGRTRRRDPARVVRSPAAPATDRGGCAPPTGSSPAISVLGAGGDGNACRGRATAVWSGSPARSRGRTLHLLPRSRCCRCSCPRSLPPPEPS